MNDVLTLALFLIVLVNVATLLLLIAQVRRDRVAVTPVFDPTPLIDAHDEASRKRQAELVGYMKREGHATRLQVAEAQELTKYQQEQQHQKTRKDIQEVKTRMADEEKTDQAAKRKARATKKKPAASK